MDNSIAYWESSIDHFDRFIPQHMVKGVKLYVINGVKMGEFGDRIFRNDFMGAATYADPINFKHLDNWARFMVNALPHMCYGSSEKVDQWLKDGGLIGIARKGSRND